MPDVNEHDRILDRFSNAHALLVPPAVLVAVACDSGLAVALECMALFGWLLLRQRTRLGRHAYPPGLANLLTLARLLVLIVVLLALDTLTRLAVFSAFALNIALDVADGRLARARNESDRLGATLDMETDAIYVLTAGLYFHLALGIGGWVLVPGLLRYAYRLAVWWLADPGFAERRRRYAAVLAGVSFVSFCAAVPLRGTMQQLALIIPTLLLCASFAVSFAELIRHAAQRPSVQ